LAGVPVAVKDLFCTEGVRTTSGSKILANFVPPYSATVVRKLESAGAVIIGKTNMDEFAMGSSCENSAFFPTRNPWDPDRVPGGSSGGSASTVGARSVPIALGTDTGGSIREPASFCNVVGVKPTYGRVSRYGIIAFASSLDQAGPMTADVRDAADTLEAIAGHDPMDSTSVDTPVPHYAGALRDELRGVRIGIVQEFEASIAGDAKMAALYKTAYAELERLGAALVPVSLAHAKYGLATYYLIAPAECSSNLARYDGARYGVRVNGDGDVYQMFEQTRAAGFGPEVKRRIILGTYALCSGYYDAYYVRAQKVRTLMKKDFDDAFAVCDVIACPAVSCPPFPLGAKSDPVAMYLMDYFTIPMSLAGIPAMSVPAGYVDGLPVGLQIAAPAFEEARMLGVAHAYEQATRFAWAASPKVGAR
jgi:aspartyl-tRNA(Asn)/glutamyl-tRNA(Gln) amidotransferase subunit A